MLASMRLSEITQQQHRIDPKDGTLVFENKVEIIWSKEMKPLLMLQNVQKNPSNTKSKNWTQTFW